MNTMGSKTVIGGSVFLLVSAVVFASLLLYSPEAPAAPEIPNPFQTDVTTGDDGHQKTGTNEASASHKNPPQQEISTSSQQQNEAPVTQPRNIDPPWANIESTMGPGTHKSLEYGFQIDYPEGWLRTTKITEPFSGDRAHHIVNFVTRRDYDEEITVISVGVYDKPSVPMWEWVSLGYVQLLRLYAVDEIPKVKAIEDANMDTALTRAKQGKQGFLTYHESRGDEGETMYEVGVVGMPGRLAYTYFITRDDSDYIYVIDLSVSLDYSGEYYGVEMFKQMVSTFQVI